jgi:retron-type reverse transcriptase
MVKALLRVERNKGAAGIDEMPVSELRSHLQEHWPRIREELLSGSYHPSAVREVMIPTLAPMEAHRDPGPEADAAVVG